jgi:serine/threonine-protein kinase
VARGSAADVYRAYDPQIDREIALRLIKIEDQDPELLAAERLGTVLQSTAERVSVQTARVLDYGEAEGFFFVATEFVQGESLDQILSSSGALSPRGAITIASKLCGFIEQLQSITPPIVHGDIKPQNIIVTDEETIRVIDFGIARLLLQTSTPTRNLFGTLPYVAPERLQKHSVDRLSDLWSVSIILYQMVTGRLPFGSASGDVAEFEREVAAGNLQHISEEIPQALAGIIRRSLDPDPEKRYSSATALRHALEEFSRTQEFVQWDSTSEASAQDSRESSDAAVYDHRTGKVLRADEIKARLDHGTDKNESAEYDELYAFVTDASTSIGHRVDNVVSSISLLRRDFAEIIELLGAGLEGSMSATVEKRQ